MTRTPAPPRANAWEWTAKAMSEKQWQALVVGYAQAAGWWCYHTFDSRRSSAGFPDLTLVRGGEMLHVELKRHNGKVTDDQARVLALLEGAGCEVHVWRPLDEPAVRARLTGPRVARVNADIGDDPAHVGRDLARRDRRWP